MPQVPPIAPNPSSAFCRCTLLAAGPADHGITRPAPRLRYIYSMLNHASHHLLQRRLNGEPLHALAAEFGLSQPVMSRLLTVAHAGCDDIRLSRRGRERIRECLCCGIPVISWHNGVRMCAACRRGEPLSDGGVGAAL